jgi:hypothetical protein
VFRKSEHQLSVDIVKGAQFTIVETPTRGPVLGPYKQFGRYEEEQGSEAGQLPCNQKAFYRATGTTPLLCLPKKQTRF